MTRVRQASLAIVITAVLAVLSTGTAFARPASCPPRHPVNLHHVNWGSVTIPGRLCRVKGVIRLRKGEARTARSGYGPLEVITSGPAYGDLGHGQQVAVLQVWWTTRAGPRRGNSPRGSWCSAAPGGSCTCWAR